MKWWHFADLDPLAICEGHFDVHESWVRNGNKWIIAFTTNFIVGQKDRNTSGRA